MTVINGKDITCLPSVPSHLNEDLCIHNSLRLIHLTIFISDFVTNLPFQKLLQVPQCEKI